MSQNLSYAAVVIGTLRVKRKTANLIDQLTFLLSFIMFSFLFSLIPYVPHDIPAFMGIIDRKQYGKKERQCRQRPTLVKC